MRVKSANHDATPAVELRTATERVHSDNRSDEHRFIIGARNRVRLHSLITNSQWVCPRKTDPCRPELCFELYTESYSALVAVRTVAQRAMTDHCSTVNTHLSCPLARTPHHRSTLLYTGSYMNA